MGGKRDGMFFLSEKNRKKW